MKTGNKAMLAWCGGYDKTGDPLEIEGCLVGPSHKVTHRKGLHRVRISVQLLSPPPPRSGAKTNHGYTLQRTHILHIFFFGKIKVHLKLKKYAIFSFSPLNPYSKTGCTLYSK
jgi:hypothetical protein